MGVRGRRLAAHHVAPPGDDWPGPCLCRSLWISASRLHSPSLGVSQPRPESHRTLRLHRSPGPHVCLPDFFGSESFYAMAFVDNLIMSATENVGAHSINSYDELSVTVGWNGMEAPIVRGMPYATMKYSGKTPSLRFGGAVLSPSGQLSGSRFEVSLNNNQKWIIYSSSDITFTVNGNNLDASGAFTGSIRAAGVWEGGENAVGDVATLDAHSDSVPV